eukprot:2504101-Pyramimonas_sp.AAC.1
MKVPPMTTTPQALRCLPPLSMTTAAPPPGNAHVARTWCPRVPSEVLSVCQCYICYIMLDV